MRSGLVYPRTSGYHESTYLESIYLKFLKNMSDKAKGVNMCKYMEFQRGTGRSDSPQVSQESTDLLTL